jgi:uncharacterized protein (DUF58 family)
MRPRLTARGGWVCAGSGALLAAGALSSHAALAGLGFAGLALLCFIAVRFALAAEELYRGSVKLAWWLEPEMLGERSFLVSRPTTLQVALRCHKKTLLDLCRLRPIAHPALELAEELWVPLRPRQEAQLSIAVTPRAAGRHVIHGAIIDAYDGLGLLRATAYFPTPLALAVLPRSLSTPVTAPFRGPASQERAGRTLLRR